MLIVTDSTLYLIKAFFLGLIEGLTEFIPVSSTAHLILVGDWISFPSDSGKVFEVVIQFGAIIAVMWVFRQRLWQLIHGTLTGVRSEVMFTRNLLIAFFPAAIVGAIFIKTIKAVLYHPSVIVFALIIGGFIMLYVERRSRTTPSGGAPHYDDTVTESRATARSIEEITWKQALAVGAAQCLAMIPGTSRSGATIIGGMIAGIQRKVATEFSFFLAMPTMLGAAVYDGYRNMDVLSGSEVWAIAVGFAGAFLSALLVVRAVLRFVSNHTYRPFAWYRIALGIVVAIWLLTRG